MYIPNLNGVIPLNNVKEISGKGWRENGKLYISFVMKDGRRYGLFNANLFYSLVKENIK